MGALAGITAESFVAYRYEGSGERALARDSCAAGEPGRRRAGLADHEEAVRGGDGSTPDPLGHPPDAIVLGRWADPKHDRAAFADEREAPFGRRRRRCECLRDRNSVLLARLLLGPAPDDSEVRQVGGPALEKLALSPLCLEERDRPPGERGCEWDAGGPTAGSDVHDRAVDARDQLDARERILEEDASRLARVPEAREAWRRDDRRQPPFQELAQSAERRGRTTT